MGETSTQRLQSLLMSSARVTAAEIGIAQARLSSIIAPTPLQYVPRLSELTGAQVYVKREDLQSVRSYKIRGAYNSIAQLTEEERAAGVVTASAGNHAQGVAFACRSLGITGRIYVPVQTPKQKLDRIRVHGGDHIDIKLVGHSFDEASEAAHQDAADTGATMIEPFDARNTVVGQGTVAAEILAQLTAEGKRLDTIFVPVGGGGLLGGILSYLGDMSPASHVVGVEPRSAASMQAALAAGGPVTLDSVDPFIDGTAVKRVGELTYQIAADAGERLSMSVIDEGAVCSELLALYQNEGIIAETAGALSVAGLRAQDVTPDSVVVCVISGGNNDVLRYAEIVERDLIYRGLKHYFLVDFPQEPGQLRHFLTDILGPDDDISRFEYVKRNNRDYGTALVGIELADAANLAPLIARMDASPLEITQLQPGTPEYEFLF
ncbi:MAG: threonine ammonia-lyase IlvA [Corynebacterium sp.]|nr:threonine ammonia-lyase IlvA [Corynebacterium sp.]